MELAPDTARRTQEGTDTKQARPVVPGTEPANEDPDIGILLDDLPRNENDVPTSDAVPANCKVDENNKDENGVPTITCAYIGGDEEAWDDPFQSTGGCELS